MSDNVEVILESANGPKVIVTGDLDAETVERELPEGWHVHPDDWNNGIKIAPKTYSYPLSRIES